MNNDDVRALKADVQIQSKVLTLFAQGCMNNDFPPRLKIA